MNLESNQEKSSHGGPRKGSGRKTGSLTAKTRDIAIKSIESGISPLEYMISVMRNEGNDPRERLDAAKSSAPYMHPRLNSVEVSGPNGGAIQSINKIELVALK